MFAIACALALASGPAVGERAGPYSFLLATGAERGQQTCYVCEQADKPTAIVFARALTPELGKLMGELSQAMARDKAAGFKAWLTVLSATADLDALAKWAQASGVGAAPVGAYEDVDGPPAYKLAREAEVTVLLVKGRKVVANYALAKGELTEAQAKLIAEAAGKLSGKGAER